MRMFQEFFHVEVNYGKRAHSCDLQFFLTWMCVCRFKQIVQVVIYDFQCSEMRLDIFLLWRSQFWLHASLREPPHAIPDLVKISLLTSAMSEWACVDLSRGWAASLCSAILTFPKISIWPWCHCSSQPSNTHTRLTANFKVLPGKIKEMINK